MLQLIGRLLLIPTLLLVTFGVFSLITLVPGDLATTAPDSDAAGGSGSAIQIMLQTISNLNFRTTGGTP